MIGKFFVISVTVLLAGWGCGRPANTDRPPTRVDERLAVYVRLPDGWESVKLNTLQMDPRSKSGMVYVEGGINVGFGKRTKPSELPIFVQVIAIPKSRADGYEKNRYPASAIRRLETPEHYIYTAVPDETVAGVADVLASLVYKK